MNTVMQTSDDNLLNIHQAAEFLQASAISLRRWTDSGRLKCYRIGARRERRFRREDLLAFLEARQDDGPGEGDVKPPVAARTSVTLEGITIKNGAHLCTFYETDLGRLKLSVPFLAEGLRHGDVCYLVASDKARGAILDGLKEITADTDLAIASGRLQLSSGQASGEEMYALFERELVKSTQSGTKSVRVLGDMAWFLDWKLGIKELIDFELRYNHALAHRFPVVSLCQYDARRFNGTGILNALKCHEDTFQYPLAHFLGV